MSFTLRREDLPERLRRIDEPPSLLYGEGEKEALFEEKVMAIVGARRCTSYGATVAFELARELARLGVVVVSGLAIGIDAKAHEGALAGGGKTIGVLGCGLKFPYLNVHRRLREAMIHSGAVITEYEAHADATPWNFPRRNRIISGLSSGVVVVEAGVESGSLITAEWALEQGREVFAVPGSIKSPLSEGTHHLIQQGAKLLTKIEDIFEELPLKEKVGYNPSKETEEEKLLGILSEGPKSMDQIIAASHLRPEKVSALLVALEIAGEVKGLPGGQFARGQFARGQFARGPA